MTVKSEVTQTFNDLTGVVEHKDLDIYLTAVRYATPGFKFASFLTLLKRSEIPFSVVQGFDPNHEEETTRKFQRIQIRLTQLTDFPRLEELVHTLPISVKQETERDLLTITIY